MRSRLTHTPFDYPIRPYTMRLSDYFVRVLEPQTHSNVIIGGLSTTQEVGLQSLVRQLWLSDGAPSTSTTAFTVLSSLDRMSLMTLYFPDEIDERGTFAEVGDIVNGTALHDDYTDEMLALSLSQIEEIVQPGLASLFDLFGVSTIKLIEEIPTAPTPEPIEGIIVGDVLFNGHVGFVEGASDFVDPPLSFDVLSGFVSRFDYVHDSSSMDLSIFEYLPVSYDIDLSVPSSLTAQIFDIDDEITWHDSDDDSSSVSDSDPIDQRVSPAVGDTEIVDFGTADEPRELRIGSDLSSNERDSLIQLLRAHLDVFAWSYEDMPGLDPSIIQHRLPLLPHARQLSRS